MPKEYIERKALLLEVEENKPLNWNDEDAEIQAEIDFDKFARMIKKQPAADVVEVVRCKECQCFELMTNNNQHFCNRFGGYVTENDYCSRPSPKNRKDK